ncbi:MAG: hypothetical protein ACRC5C_13030 [Bacilli bacterium]
MRARLKKISFTQYLCLTMIIALIILDGFHIFMGVWNNILSAALIAYFGFSFYKKDSVIAQKPQTNHN